MAGYLGNKFNMQVHHLALMTSACGIRYVKKENSVYFVPDTLDQAIKENFVPCEYCINK